MIKVAGNLICGGIVLSVIVVTTEHQRDKTKKVAKV